jgi:AcrR family transcriptional regulator
VTTRTKALPANDLETETRLLNAAARLFAARGFKNVSVREICALADANVAAVNYHFGDKLGLYRQVLGKAISTMQATTEAARLAGAGAGPEDKLRAYVRVFLQRVSARSRESWIHQLMGQEMADPTPALDLVFEQVIRPRLAYVAQIVAEIAGRDVNDPTVIRSVVSIQAQCHAAMVKMMSPVVERMIPDLLTDGAGIERLASHIAEFSLAGIRAVAARPAVAGRRR